MSEIWTPEHYIDRDKRDPRFPNPYWKFEPGQITDPEIKEKQLSSEEYFRWLLDYIGDQQLSSSELGIAIGKSVLAVHQEYIDTAPERIRKTHREFRAWLGDSQAADQLLSGWLGEFATAYALNSLCHQDQQAYYPQKQEDRKHGIDWWLHSTSNGRDIAVPIQVKVLPLNWDGRKEVMQRLIFPVSITDEADRLSLAGRYTKPLYTGQAGEETDEKGIPRLQTRVYNSITKLANEASRYENVKPALMILPGIFSEESVVHSQLGTFMKNDEEPYPAEKIKSLIKTQLQNEFGWP